MDKLLKENAEKLPEEVKNEVQADVDALKQALENTDNEDEVNAAYEKLQASQVKIGEALYAQGSESTPGAEEAPAGEAGGEDEDIVDAEVVDEDDDADKK